MLFLVLYIYSPDVKIDQSKSKVVEKRYRLNIITTHIVVTKLYHTNRHIAFVGS